MAYRAIILSSEPATNGNVHIAIQVETDRSGSWQQSPIGRRTLILSGDEILAITKSRRNAANKQAALKALIIKGISDWGIIKSDEASQQLTHLIDQGWPQTVEL